MAVPLGEESKLETVNTDPKVMREKNTKIEQLMLRSKKLADNHGNLQASVANLQAHNTNLQASVANLQAHNTNLQAEISNRQKAVASLSGRLKQSILSEIELPKTCVGPKGAECQATPEQQDVEAIGDSEYTTTNMTANVTASYEVETSTDKKLNTPWTMFTMERKTQWDNLVRTSFTALPSNGHFMEYVKWGRKFSSPESCSCTQQTLITKFGECGTNGGSGDVWEDCNCPTNHKRQPAACTGTLNPTCTDSEAEAERDSEAGENEHCILNHVNVTNMRGPSGEMKDYFTFHLNGINMYEQPCRMQFGLRIARCLSCNDTLCDNSGGSIIYETSSQDLSANTSHCQKWFVSAMTAVSGFGSLLRKDQILKRMRKCQTVTPDAPPTPHQMQNATCPAPTRTPTRTPTAASTSTRRRRSD